MFGFPFIISLYKVFFFRHSKIWGRRELMGTQRIISQLPLCLKIFVKYWPHEMVLIAYVGRPTPLQKSCGGKVKICSPSTRCERAIFLKFFFDFFCCFCCCCQVVFAFGRAGEGLADKRGLWKKWKASFESLNYIFQSIARRPWGLGPRYEVCKYRSQKCKFATNCTCSSCQAKFAY